MRSITFFNNKGGVGKTTAVYHVAWMLSEMHIRTIAVDLDPQSNLTSMFLSEDRITEVYGNNQPVTILDAISPIVKAEQTIPVHIEEITESLGLIMGNLALSTYEDDLSDAWLKCLNGNTFAFKITSLVKTIVDEAAKRFDAEVVLIDVGPNLGAINRVVAISSDYIIMPVASDLFSLQGIKNLGTTLENWKGQWTLRMEHKPKDLTIPIPQNDIIPVGYILMQYSAKESKPVNAYLNWANRIPNVYSEYVTHANQSAEINIESDPNCLALLKHFRSLAPMSMEVHKPIFLLRPADGAIGAHVYAVKQAYEEFNQLTQRILKACS